MFLQRTFRCKQPWDRRTAFFRNFISLKPPSGTWWRGPMCSSPQGYWFGDGKQLSISMICNTVRDLEHRALLVPLLCLAWYVVAMPGAVCRSYARFSCNSRHLRSRLCIICLRILSACCHFADRNDADNCVIIRSMWTWRRGGGGTCLMRNGTCNLETSFLVLYLVIHIALGGHFHSCFR